MSIDSASKQAIRSNKRKQEILEAARAVFLEHGYSGASIDAILARTGGSKETLYCYFGNKEGLLNALVENVAAQFSLTLDQPLAADDLEQGLLAIGRTFLPHILSAEALDCYRLLLAEAGRRPELGDLFYRLCIEAFVERVTRYFSAVAHRIPMARENPREFAITFIGMLRGDLQIRSLFNPTRVPSPAEIERHIRFVVGMVLKLCEAA